MACTNLLESSSESSETNAIWESRIITNDRHDVKQKKLPFNNYSLSTLHNPSSIHLSSKLPSGEPNGNFDNKSKSRCREPLTTTSDSTITPKPKPRGLQKWTNNYDVISVSSAEIAESPRTVSPIIEHQSPKTTQQSVKTEELVEMEIERRKKLQDKQANEQQNKKKRKGKSLGVGLLEYGSKVLQPMLKGRHQKSSDEKVASPEKRRQSIQFQEQENKIVFVTPPIRPTKKVPKRPRRRRSLNGGFFEQIRAFTTPGAGRRPSRTSSCVPGCESLCGSKRSRLLPSSQGKTKGLYVPPQENYPRVKVMTDVGVGVTPPQSYLSNLPLRTPPDKLGRKMSPKTKKSPISSPVASQLSMRGQLSPQKNATIKRSPPRLPVISSPEHTTAISDDLPSELFRNTTCGKHDDTCGCILGYWNIRGQAEPIRYILEYLKIPYCDKRYNFGPPPDYHNNEWLSDSKTMKTEFATLPYFTQGENTFFQSLVILRHLARENNLDAQDPEEEYRIDLLEQQILQLRWDIGRVVFAEFFQQAKAIYMKNLPDSLKEFTEICEYSTWLLGNRLTYVDFMFFETLDWIKLFTDQPKFLHKTLKKFHKRFSRLPGVQEYIDSRPVFPVFGPLAQWGYVDKVASKISVPETSYIKIKRNTILQLNRKNVSSKESKAHAHFVSSNGPSAVSSGLMVIPVVHSGSQKKCNKDDVVNQLSEAFHSGDAEPVYVIKANKNAKQVTPQSQQHFEEVKPKLKESITLTNKAKEVNDTKRQQHIEEVKPKLKESITLTNKAKEVNDTKRQQHIEEVKPKLKESITLTNKAKEVNDTKSTEKVKQKPVKQAKHDKEQLKEHPISAAARERRRQRIARAKGASPADTPDIKSITTPEFIRKQISAPFIQPPKRQNIHAALVDSDSTIFQFTNGTKTPEVISRKNKASQQTETCGVFGDTATEKIKRVHLHGFGSSTESVLERKKKSWNRQQRKELAPIKCKKSSRRHTRSKHATKTRDKKGDKKVTKITAHITDDMIPQLAEFARKQKKEAKDKSIAPRRQQASILLHESVNQVNTME